MISKSMRKEGMISMQITPVILVGIVLALSFKSGGFQFDEEFVVALSFLIFGVLVYVNYKDALSSGLSERSDGVMSEMCTSFSEEEKKIQSDIKSNKSDREILSSYSGNTFEKHGMQCLEAFSMSSSEKDIQGYHKIATAVESQLGTMSTASYKLSGSDVETSFFFDLTTDITSPRIGD